MTAVFLKSFAASTNAVTVIVRTVSSHVIWLASGDIHVELLSTYLVTYLYVQSIFAAPFTFSDGWNMSHVDRPWPFGCDCCNTFGHFGLHCHVEV